MTRASRRARVRYFVDGVLAKGTPVLIGWLAVSTVAAVIFISVVAYLTGASGMSFPRLLWEGIQRVLDPGGVVSSSSANDSAVFMVAMFVCSVLGVVALALLIGFVTTDLVKVFQELRRGRSTVIEKGHTLILGWSEHVPTIISETAIANENHPGLAIVVLADRDPVELRDVLADKVGGIAGSRVIFRRGDPIGAKDLETVSFSEARSIIIAPGDHTRSDGLEIKTLLAITNHPRRRSEPYHIVMSLADPSNTPVTEMIAGREVEVVVFRDVAARIVAQTCRQPGLSTVHTELMDFEGDEIYFQEEPGLVGKTFGEALTCYEDSAVIGLCPAGGEPSLSSDFDRLIRPGDEIIAISRDDDTVQLCSSAPEIQTDAIVTEAIDESAPERTLILGWAPSVPTIIAELDAYVAAGSTVTVLTPEAEPKKEVEQLGARLSRETVSVVEGVPTDRATLDALDVPSYDHVIVCGSSDPDPQEADAHALLTLLHLRDISRMNGAFFSVVTEMRDIRNRELATVAEVDDFVVSEHLLSLMLAQIAENKRLKPIFEDLFDPEGAEIYLKPVTNYVRCGRPVTFYTVVEAARRRGEIAIGYRRLAGDGGASELGFGVVVNPLKSEPVTFGEHDRVIVVAED